MFLFVNLLNVLSVYRKGTSIRQVPEFGTSKHNGKAHGISSGWMICNDTVLHPAIFSYLILIIPLKEVWKKLSALFRVLNTGAFMLYPFGIQWDMNDYGCYHD